MGEAKQLAGRVALITGGGGEIGGAIARRFSSEGALVAVADIRGDAAREVALLHHERWDGGGYPGVEEDGIHRGRRGEEIPLFARIVGLADVFDALSTHRCYKEAWPEADVLQLIQSESARHFDPELVDIFFVQLDSIRRVRDSNEELS